MTKVTIQVFDSVEALQTAAARQLAHALGPSTAGRDVRVALSGGSTPRRMHELLAEAPGIDWSRVHVYFGDERSVPPDDPDSNYRMARETLLDRTGIPEPNVYRMRGEIDPVDAAQEYQAELERTFGVKPPEFPRFDAIVLGLGTDGHTASLFPGTDALHERRRWVVANHVPQLGTKRITLTYPVLNNAALVMFLAAGTNKRDALRGVFGPADQERPPAAHVQPSGKVVWLLDADAGAALSADAVYEQSTQS